MEGMVEVWDACLEPEADRLAACRAVLSAAELERASAFRFPRDRDRFILAHGQLRLVLGSCLSMDPAELPFGEGEYGKPFLAGSAQADLRFNLSHSQDRALLAVSRAGEVGVDLEFAGGETDPRDFSKTFLTSGEQNQVNQLRGEAGRRRIFDYWTAKEAYLKAIGMGFHRDPLGFEVEFPSAEGGPIAFRRLDDSPDDCASWQGMALDRGLDYSATVVSGGASIVERGLVRIG